jgi:uncharacterized YigZ family protein
MQDMNDSFRTIANPCHSELTIVGSRFIAEAFPVSAPEQAECQIAAVRRREYNATHNCTAYRIGITGDIFRANDDGEPSGTAGRPILQRINAHGLTNVLVVVTRYFGGTKLGTGGLIRAYGDAAEEVLQGCEIVERIVRARLRLGFEYPDTSPAMHTIGRFDAHIVRSDYSELTQLTVDVRLSEVQAFTGEFTAALAGRGSITLQDSPAEGHKATDADTHK